MAQRRKRKRNWIAGAIKRPGSLTAAARRAGQSPMEFARRHKGSPGKVGKRARLALTLGKLGRRRKRRV